MRMNPSEVVSLADPDDRVTTDRLMADFRLLAADMEHLLKAVGNQTGQHAAQVRVKAEHSLRAAKAHVGELQDMAAAKTRAAGRATDDYVRANPWQVLAICTFAGFLLGAMLWRSGESES
jgi:ElaB/YqjD/DUF883 family membrane-anchored ribosome-binding protein